MKFRGFHIQSFHKVCLVLLREGIISSDRNQIVTSPIAQRLSPDLRGVINLVSERAPCLSCTSVIDQFRKMFPNINLNVIGGSRNE